MGHTAGHYPLPRSAAAVVRLPPSHLRFYSFQRLPRFAHFTARFSFAHYYTAVCANFVVAVWRSTAVLGRTTPSCCTHGSTRLTPYAGFMDAHCRTTPLVRTTPVPPPNQRLVLVAARTRHTLDTHGALPPHCAPGSVTYGSRLYTFTYRAHGSPWTAFRWLPFAFFALLRFAHCAAGSFFTRWLRLLHGLYALRLLVLLPVSYARFTRIYDTYAVPAPLTPGSFGFRQFGLHARWTHCVRFIHWFIRAFLGSYVLGSRAWLRAHPSLYALVPGLPLYTHTRFTYLPHAG